MGDRSGASIMVPLEYRETHYQFMFREVSIERRLAHFPKEPAAAGGPVVRGVLKFGSNPSNAIPFVWQGKNWMARASEAFAFSPKLFFGGQACRAEWASEPRSTDEKLDLRLTEQPTALGELRITGSFIHRLVLTGEPYTVVLTEPAAAVKVPPGRYYPYRVQLKHGKAEAYFEFGLPSRGKANLVEETSGAQMPVVSPPGPEEAVVVDERRGGTLAVGGPLTNCVSSSRVSVLDCGSPLPLWISPERYSEF